MDSSEGDTFDSGPLDLVIDDGLDRDIDRELLNVTLTPDSPPHDHLSAVSSNDENRPPNPTPPINKGKAKRPKALENG